MITWMTGLYQITAVETGKKEMFYHVVALSVWAWNIGASLNDIEGIELGLLAV